MKSIYLFLKISGSHRNLILLLTSCITGTLGSNVILSSTCPIFIVFKFVWYKLFPRFLDHRLWFEFFIGKGSCTWIKISARRCKRKCQRIKDNFCLLGLISFDCEFNYSLLLDSAGDGGLIVSGLTQSDGDGDRSRFVVM